MAATPETAANTSVKMNDANAQSPIVLSGAANQKKPTPDGVQIAYFQVTVRFLDETAPLEVKIDKLTTGQDLVDRVCEHLQLAEKGYFGLRYDGADNERYWLDAKRSVYKQLKLAESRVVHFRVRYYPGSMNLREEITRYQFFLQLRRDLFRGRLLCPLSDAYELAALILQSELGDYDAELCKPGYVSEFPLLPRQTSKLEERIAELHKSMVGMTPAEAESRLLNIASHFDTFGVDPFAVRPGNENAISLTRNVIAPKQSDAGKREEPTAAANKSKSGDSTPSAPVSWFIGINHAGVVLFSSSRAARVFKWEEVAKMVTDGRLFVVHTYAPSDIPTSISFTAGPLTERDEEAQPDGNGKPPSVAADGDNAKPKENEDASGVRSGAKLSKSASVRETKKEREAKQQPQPQTETQPGENHVEQAPTVDRAATLKPAALSRTGTLHRNSIASRKAIVYEFRCETPAAAKSLWLMAVDQQAFFTLETAEEAQKVKSVDGFRLFARSAKFRFSGRCERELSEHATSIQRAAPNFERTPSARITTEIRTRRAPSLLVPNSKKDEPDLKVSAESSATVSENGTGPAPAIDTPRADEPKVVVESSSNGTSAPTRDACLDTPVAVEKVVQKSVTNLQVHTVPTTVRPEATVPVPVSVPSDAPKAEKRVLSNHNDKHDHETKRAGREREQIVLHPAPTSNSTMRTLCNAMVVSLVLFVALVLFLTLLYETDFVEQPAKSVMGVSLRKNAAVAKLAELTYKPIKQLAASLFRASK